MQPDPLTGAPQVQGWRQLGQPVLPALQSQRHWRHAPHLRLLSAGAALGACTLHGACAGPGPCSVGMQALLSVLAHGLFWLCARWRVAGIQG